MRYKCLSLCLVICSSLFSNVFAQDTIVLTEETIEEAEVFLVVENQPQFPGGEDAMKQFLRENINYPQIAKESGIQGTVYVNFIVEPNGSLTNIKVRRGIGGGCDEESIRVVKMMPRWEPGTQRGKPVRVSYNIPIKYTLQTKSGKKKPKKKLGKKEEKELLF